MEITLEGKDHGLWVQGNITVELPSYMHVLPPDELEVAQHSSEGKRLALAAGRRSPEGDVVVLTSQGELMEVTEASEKGIPRGNVRAIECGRKVAFTHGEGDDVEVDVEEVLEHAKSMLFLGALASQTSKDGTRIVFVDDEAEA